MASPLRFQRHAEPHSLLMVWLDTYKVMTPGVRIGDNATVRLDLDNEPQPDVVLLIDEQLGGQAYISNDDYVEGAPEQVLENKLDWFSLQNSEYVLLPADAEGVIKSRVFPGLWLAVNALISKDMKHVIAVLQQGLNSTEHALFLQGTQSLYC